MIAGRAIWLLSEASDDATLQPTMIPDAILIDEILDNRRVLRFVGRLTVARINALSRQTYALEPDDRPLLIDLTAVERIDTDRKSVV